VLVPSFTFAAASTRSVRRRDPCLVDILTDTIRSTRQTLSVNHPPYPAVMVVDVFGHPAEWDAILALCRNGMASKSSTTPGGAGATYKGRKIGQFRRMRRPSPSIPQATDGGEGGIARYQRDEMPGSPAASAIRGAVEMGAWLEHERLGYNYRWNEIPPRGALPDAPHRTFLTRRERVAQAYNERLAASIGSIRPQPRPMSYELGFVYVITLKPGLSRGYRDDALPGAGSSGRALFLAYSSPTLYRAAARFNAMRLPITDSIACRTIALRSITISPTRRSTAL